LFLVADRKLRGRAAHGNCLPLKFIVSRARCSVRHAAAEPSGRLLAALERSYGVGVDFSTKVLAKADALYPDLDLVLGDVEDPATLAGIGGPFDHIVIADSIGTFEVSTAP
jgi:hypothetical protein